MPGVYLIQLKFLLPLANSTATNRQLISPCRFSPSSFFILFSLTIIALEIRKKLPQRNLSLKNTLIMSILVNTVQKVLGKAGLRLLWSRNIPRGTESRLYNDVNNYLAQSKETAVVLDVGANFGNVTSELRHVFPSLTIHAFEPSPDVFTSVSRRFAGQSQISVHQLALSSQPGTMPFQARPDEPGLARLSQTETASTVPVHVETVDRFLANHGISTVALMKTDTEGYELEVMAGASEALAAGRILSILVECAPGEGTHRHVPIRRLTDMLASYGFELFGLYDFGYRPSGAMHFCNALFKLKKVQQPK